MGRRAEGVAPPLLPSAPTISTIGGGAVRMSPAGPVATVHIAVGRNRDP
jgi:hypothetical protein